MESSKEVAASEKEQKPAGEESEKTSSEPSSTSSGMLTLSGEKCRSDDEDLETEISRWKGKLKKTLDVPALLLTTLEEMNPDGLRRFQSYLTSGHPFSFPLIPKSQLENVDRQVTVDQMVKRYDPEGAVENTLKILRRSNLDDLAEKLERDHTRVSPSFSGVPTASYMSLFQPRPKSSLSPLYDAIHPLLSSSPSFLLSLTTGSSGQFSSQRPFTEEQLKIFQSSLSSDPESQLENTDRQDTMDQMVERYGTRRAVGNTLKILRRTNRHNVAEKLERDQATTCSSDTGNDEKREKKQVRLTTSSRVWDRVRHKATQHTHKHTGSESNRGFRSERSSSLLLPSSSSSLQPVEESMCHLAFNTLLHASHFHVSPTQPNDPILGQALPISPSPVSRSPSCSSSDTGPSEEEREERVLPAQRVVADTEMEELTCKESTPTVQSAEDPVSNSLTPTVQSAEDPVSNSLTPTVQSAEDPVSNSMTPTVQSTEDPASNSLTPTVQSTEDPASNSLTPTVQSAEDPVSNSLTPTVQSAEDPVSNSLTPTVQSAEDPGPSYSYNVLSLTSSWQPSLELCNEFTPDILDHEGNGTYRFQCPRAGLFQCSITGLVFRMEGEVLFRTVHWDTRLLSQRGKRPAGPLFMFRCLKGSVSQLHLPHCQMHSDGGCDFLSVAHVTDDNMEFIPPQEITETHIIINITGFSAYGIVHEEDAPISPIQGLVLIFYQPFVPEQRSILNVLLLPSNVVRKEVREVIERDGIREILTTSQCKLTPKQEYTLSTYSADGHRIEPKEAEFVKCDSYENYYYPTFQLFLQTIVKEVDLLLKEKEGDELVWNRLVWLPASPTDVPSTVSAVSPAAPTANPSIPPGRAFIRRNRMSLETRLGLLQPIFLRLQDHGVLIHEEREEVVSKSTKTLQNQALLDMVVRKGSRAQEHFYQVLKEVDPCLVEDLEEQTV